MTNDMDDLLALYRRASQEAPSLVMDARILRAADETFQLRRRYRYAAWTAAIAASVLLWSAWRTQIDRPAESAVAMAGYDVGTARVELLQMDVMPPHSDVDRFLLSVPVSTLNP